MSRSIPAVVSTALLLTVAAAGTPAASLEPDRLLPNCCGVNVRIPAAGDINLTVVRFGGRRLPRASLTNLRRLPSGALVVAARRPLKKGRSEVWLGVVNRAPTSTRVLSTEDAADDTAVKFRISGGPTLRRAVTIQLGHLAAWPARPPAVCNGITDRNIVAPGSPRPLQAWDARTDTPVEPAAFLSTWADYVRAACDLPLSPLRAEKWGIPYGAFTLTVKPPSSLLVTGSISADSMGFVLTRLPEGIVSIGGRDGAPCAASSRGTEHFIACLNAIQAKQPIELEITFSRSLDRSAFVFDPVLGVFVRNVEYGPYSVSLNP